MVGTASASDPDGDSLTFALTDDAGGRFAIDPVSGVISVADGTLIEYDEATAHNISVAVTDPGGLSDTETFVVDVQKDNSGDDFIFGTEEADVIEGGPGNDTIDGKRAMMTCLAARVTIFCLAARAMTSSGVTTGTTSYTAPMATTSCMAVMVTTFCSASSTTICSTAAPAMTRSPAAWQRYLRGGEGNDYVGGQQDDIVIGGAGNDTLSGGSGTDRFVFESPDDGIDQILDFTTQCTEGDILAISHMLVDFAEGEEASFVRYG